MPVALTDGGLLIAGREVPVYSGTVHYWRLERERWNLILDQVQALGFEMIETYIPWSIHETAPGQFDWGTEDPRKDVEAFMRLCEERGIWLLVRPGPLINAELTDFGFPEWVLLDPCVQAHTAVGSLHLDAAWGLHPPHQFPVPSYASEEFYAYVGGWFDAVAPIIKRHLAPKGCVVAVQSDNETCYLFHDQPYATDYSIGSLRLYRETFLAAKYGDIAALNEAYGSNYSAFAEVEPPRDGDVANRADLPLRLDWVEYKEFQITWSVSRCARMLRERGLGEVPVFHDVAYQQKTPLDLNRMEADPQLDWVGINLYRNKEEYRYAIQQTRYMNASSRLSFVPELGCGIWSHYPLTPEPQDHELVTLGMLMHGLKAFNLYMLVERERWQACPINRHGQQRPEYAQLYSRMMKFLHKHELWRFKHQPKALVLRNYDLGRHAAALSTLNYAHADLLGLPRELFTTDADLDLRWDAVTEASEHPTASWFGNVLKQLRERSLDYDLSDTHIDPARLQNYPVVFVQATDFMDLADQQQLIAAIEAGATVIIGPGLPYTDPTLRQEGLLHRLLTAPGVADLGQGKLIWAAAEQLPALIDSMVPAAEFRSDQPALDLSLLRSEDKALLFAANPTDSEISASVSFSGCYKFVTAWGSATTTQADGSFAVEIAPYSVAVWEVQRD